ncbi:class I SAM-dependent methyltransferase [Tautonia rosea]|uniref:class I SAM-dependent methyltransferase n=1 Tax=Tautonia rosea TaxID=2728037 RepID=UPI0014757A1B|nr:class I SAM-dependent methyltransferase [Tautonia rosea]
MDDVRLLIDFHKDATRQGPGSDAETERALTLARVDRSKPLTIADIGCGTGASTLVLARLLNATITAVDLFQDFLDVLETRASEQGLSEKITTLCASMDALPFADEQFDVIWSEGAIYNIGFENGVKTWNRFLNVGGLLAVSEITWTTGSRPAELQAHWEREYPEIDVASSKLRVLEQNGYMPIGYFVLPEHCWLDHYYRPIQHRLDQFLARHDHRADAQAIVDAEIREIALYETYRASYSYGFYLARKVGRHTT